MPPSEIKMTSNPSSELIVSIGHDLKSMSAYLEGAPEKSKTLKESLSLS
jgi:hypothetical protein